jgi:SAM-dependent methyltransferase
VADDPGDYILGTHDAEVDRLGLQHRAWREAVLAAWRHGGLRAGMRVLDVGAGPGFATIDLAEIVGSAGTVIAVERSPRFIDVLRREVLRRDLTQVKILEGDLMTLAPVPACDMAWCRWVAAFVESMPTLVRWLAGSIKPGGRVVLHEYAAYGSWRFAPPRPRLRKFVMEVMASWRASGGEPDIAPALVGALADAGFTVVSTRPHVFSTKPGELAWEWPARFVTTHAERLRELGRVSGDWVEAVVSELQAAESDPRSVMITPLVLEIVAERR